MAANPLKIATRGTTTQLRTYSGPLGSIAVDTLTGALVAGNGTAGGVRMALEKDAIVGISLSGTTLTITRGNGTAYGITLPTSGSGGGGSSVVAHAILSTGTAIGTVTVDGVVTTFYAPSASGGTGGSTVSVNPTLYSGTQIATITVDGSPITLYAPAASSGGSTVSVNPILTTGTQIATITVDGTPRAIYAPAASSGGSTVSVNPILTTGTQIATITVDGTPRAIYAPAASSGGSTVSVNPMLGSGTQIATITVDGSPFALYAPAASSGGSTVSVNPMLGSGTQIATITIDGSPFTLYAPSASEAPSVSYISSVSSGTTIGTLNVGNSSYTLYAPSAGDVSYTASVTAGTTLGTLKVGNSNFVIYGPGEATSSKAGLLSATDKAKLDSVKEVSVSPLVSSGTRIATINVGSSSYTLYAPEAEAAPTTGPSLTGNNTFTGTNWFATDIGVYNNDLNSETAVPSSAVLSHLYFSSKSKTAADQGTFAQLRAGRASSATSIGMCFIWNSASAMNGVEAGYNSSGDVAFFKPVVGNNGSKTSGIAAMTLGSSTYRWSNVFAGTTTIGTSDATLKQDVGAIPDDVLDAWDNVDWIRFRFISAVEDKGEKARYHTGAISQSVAKVFTDAGLDPSQYGLYCYDYDPGQPAVYVVDKATGEKTLDQPAVEPSEIYSLRYTEALCVEAAYQRRRAARLEARVEELETKLASVLERLGDNS